MEEEDAVVGGDRGRCWGAVRSPCNRGTRADPSCRSFYYYFFFSCFLMVTWERGILSSSSLVLI